MLYEVITVERFPEITGDENLLTLQEMLDNPVSLLLHRDEFTAAVTGLAQRFSYNFV